MKLKVSGSILFAVFLVCLTIPGFLSEEYKKSFSFRSIASLSAQDCFNTASNLVRDNFRLENSLAEFVDSYETITAFAQLYPNARIDNQTYRILAYDHDGLEKDIGLHISSSFKYLKTINDHVNKSFGTALENFNKSSFLKYIEQNPLLMSKLKSSYFDYKGHREIFYELTATELKELNGIFQRVLKKQAEVVGAIPELKAILKNSNLPPPDHWHRIGIGPGADKANFSAKMANYINDENQVITYEQAKQHAPKVLRAIRYLESKIFNPEKFIPSMMDYDPVSDQSFLSMESCAVLRKIDGDPLKLIRRFEDRFNAKLSMSEAKNIIDYFKYTDVFSPELVIAERTLLDLSGAQGVISADIAGMGARNASSLMRHIRNTGTNLEDTLHSARSSEISATKEYMDLLNFYDGVLRESKLYSQAGLPSHSGDDVAIRIIDKMSEQQINQRFLSLVAKLAESDEYATSFRLVRCPGVYADSSGEELGQEMVNAHIVDTEQVLKNTRLLCEQAGFYRACKSLVLAGKVTPYKGGKAVYDLIVAGDMDSTSELTRAKLSSIFKESIKLISSEAQVSGQKQFGQVIFLD